MAKGILRLLARPKILNLANFFLRPGDWRPLCDFAPHAAMAVLGLPIGSKCMMFFVSNQLVSPTQKAAEHMTFVAMADQWHRFPIH